MSDGPSAATMACVFGKREDRLMAKLDEMTTTLQREFELNRQEFELNRQEFELNRRELELNREARANDRAVLTELTQQIRASTEDSRRHNDATVGALTDLAAEIRGWGGGAAPA